MRRLTLALVAMAALALGLPAGAQADLGNDGEDMDCGDFAELNAAQAYFVTDGGAAGRNVDNLDADGDGNACEASDQAAEGGATPVATAAPADGTGDDTAGVYGGTTTTLPSTGAGPGVGRGAGVLALALLAGCAAVGLAALRGYRRA